jgi:hypothetical protein
MTGLNATNLLAKLRETGHLEEAFGCRPTRITAALFESTFKINWSEEGSNRRSQEQEVISRWNDILEDFQGQ